MRPNKFIFILKGIAFLTLSPFLIYGQLLDPVQYQLVSLPDTVKAGEIFEVKIKATIEPDWHLYSVDNAPDAGPYPTTFTSASNGLAIAGQVIETTPDIAFDPNFNTELGWHSDEALFKVPAAFQVKKSSNQNFSIDILYQVCDDVSCLPPKTKTVTADLVISGVSEQPYMDFVSDETSGLSNLQESYIYIGSAVFIVGFILGLIYLKRQFLNKSLEFQDNRKAKK